MIANKSVRQHDVRKSLAVQITLRKILKMPTLHRIVDRMNRDGAIGRLAKLNHTMQWSLVMQWSNRDDEVNFIGDSLLLLQLFHRF